MDKDRKTYTVSLENSVDETYVMSLTDDQVKVFKWLKDVGKMELLQSLVH